MTPKLIPIFKKIFSVKNEYQDGIKHKIIYFLGIKFSFKVNYKQKFLKLQKDFVQTEKSLKGKDSINIAFLVSLSSMFPARPLLDYLLSKPTRYKVKIIIVPDFRFGIENTYKLQDECYNELSESYDKDIIIKVPVDENEDDIDISEIADILFFPFPYDVSHEKYKLENLVQKNILLAMINYGVSILPDFAKVSFSHPRLCYFKYLFYETSSILKEYKKYSIVNGKNAVLSGYCKMDKYQNSLDKKERKTVILAPHHSVAGGFNDVLSLSNFYQYSDFFLELPELYPNIDWIFRPHPALFPLLERDTFWGKEKVDGYINKMKSYPNVRYSHGGNYFDDFALSDGIIQDCESFLFEYFYTGKPQCYMLKEGINIKQKFGTMGSNLLKHCYCAFSKEDICNYIDKVILN